MERHRPLPAERHRQARRCRDGVGGVRTEVIFLFYRAGRGCFTRFRFQRFTGLQVEIS